MAASSRWNKTIDATAASPRHRRYCEVLADIEHDLSLNIAGAPMAVKTMAVKMRGCT